jgi:hypothetical protein
LPATPLTVEFDDGTQVACSFSNVIVNNKRGQKCENEECKNPLIAVLGEYHRKQHVEKWHKPTVEPKAAAKHCGTGGAKVWDNFFLRAKTAPPPPMPPPLPPPSPRAPTFAPTINEHRPTVRDEQIKALLDKLHQREVRMPHAHASALIHALLPRSVSRRTTRSSTCALV